MYHTFAPKRQAQFLPGKQSYLHKAISRRHQSFVLTLRSVTGMQHDHRTTRAKPSTHFGKSYSNFAGPTRQSHQIETSPRESNLHLSREVNRHLLAATERARYKPRFYRTVDSLACGDYPSAPPGQLQSNVGYNSAARICNKSNQRCIVTHLASNYTAPLSLRRSHSPISPEAQHASNAVNLIVRNGFSI